MKFKIVKEDILNSLKIINNITFNDLNYKNEKNIIFIIIKNFLYIIGNNFKIEIITKLCINNENNNKLNISISYTKLLNICKNISNKTIINFYKRNNFIFLKTDESIFSIKLYPLELLNRFILTKKILEICISKNNLLFLIKKTYFSISNDNINTCLNGMLFNIINNNIMTISTDSYRLSFCKIILNYNIINNSFILYKKSILELIKFLENCNEINFILTIYEKFISVNSNNSKFVSKILNNDFPNYDIITNKKYIYSILINKNNFKSSINRVSSILEDKNYLVKFKIHNNFILLKTKNYNNEKAKEKILVSYLGPKIEIGINYNYILDILLVIDDNNIIFNFSDNKSSIEIIEENYNNKKYIIMPIKI